MDINNPTHRDFDELLRDVLLTHDYTVFTREARSPGENLPQRGNRWLGFSPGPLINDQAMDQLEDCVQELTEAIAEVLPSKVNLSKFELYTQKTTRVSIYSTYTDFTKARCCQLQIGIAIYLYKD